MSYLVYLIVCDNLYYIGMTNNFTRRIQQHNGILKGGAKFTKRKKDWNPILIIDGFTNKSEAMQCEWAFKNRRGNNLKGIDGRIKHLQTLLNKNKWTSKSDLIENQNLKIYILNNYKKMINIKTYELDW
jgi:predicted GIY-YIG superfamily endonuclease